MGNRLMPVNVLELVVLVYFMFDVCESLTTSVVRESTSPKPSTIYRRISVDRYTDIQSKALLRLDTNTRRRNTDTDSEIWKWDNWCLLQPRKGSCGQKLLRYYYNRVSEECVSFTYSGCDANKNNFESKLDCERRCSGVNVILNTEAIPKNELCQYQPDSGACVAYESMYFYDINKRSCVKFMFGGCAGKSNRFYTENECMLACK